MLQPESTVSQAPRSVIQVFFKTIPRTKMNHLHTIISFFKVMLIIIDQRVVMLLNFYFEANTIEVLCVSRLLSVSTI